MWADDLRADQMVARTIGEIPSFCFVAPTDPPPLSKTVFASIHAFEHGHARRRNSSVRTSRALFRWTGTCVGNPHCTERVALPVDAAPLRVQRSSRPALIENSGIRAQAHISPMAGLRERRTQYHVTRDTGQGQPHFAGRRA